MTSPAALCLVWCDVLQEQPEPALARARQEVEAHPQSGLAWAGLALALSTAGEEKEARAALDKAQALASEDGWVEAVAEHLLSDGHQ